MYLTNRIALVRNLSVAGVNGAITLIILLIAPMGLAGVISNTILVALSTFFTATFADRVVRFLQGDRQNAELNAGVEVMPNPREGGDIERQ